MSNGPSLTMEDDKRFTRSGRLLAKLKLDEVPQLWHVLTGEMSLVGPRPESPEFVHIQPSDYAAISRCPARNHGPIAGRIRRRKSRILDPEANPVDHYVGQILPQKVGARRHVRPERTLWLQHPRSSIWTAAAVIMRRRRGAPESGRMNLRKR